MVELIGFEMDIETPTNYTLVLALVSVIVNVYAPVSQSPVLIGKYSTSDAFNIDDIIGSILMPVSLEANIRILLDADISPKKPYSEENEHVTRFFYKKDKAIWFVDSLGSFIRLKSDILNDNLHYERNGNFILVYSGRDPDYLKTLNIIFEQFYSIRLININVLVTFGETVYVYTYFPFLRECGNNRPVLDNIFGPSTDYRFRQETFFSKKLHNMWGCEVRITSWDIPPFTMVKYKGNTSEFERLDGIEGKLIGLIAERMNFTIKFVAEPNNERGIIYPNGTSTGTIRMLINNQTDITIACFKYDMQRVGPLAPAYIYLNAPLNLAIPKGQRMTPFERLVRPFQYIIWSCFSSSILFGILVIFILKTMFKAKVQEFIFGRSNRIPLTNFFAGLYGNAIASSLPRRNFARYLLAAWMIYTWVMRCAYTGQLFILLQDSRGRTTLNTIQEVVDKNYTFYTYYILLPSLQGSSLRKLNIEFVDDSALEGLFAHLGEDENANAAVTVLGHRIRAYNQNSRNHKRRVNILSEPLFNTPITFYMNKNTILSGAIDETLINLMSSGFVKRFEDLFLKTESESSQHVPATLSLWLLLGPFSLYICLALLSTLVFLMELWSKHSPLTKKFINFFNV